MADKKTAPKDMTAASLKQMQMAALMSVIESRSAIASRLGQAFQGKRDLYTAFGYQKTLTFNDYMARYKRQDIAQGIIDRPVRECWKHVPDIVESDSDITEFERKWTELASTHQIFSEFSRVDKLSSIGRYAILVLGLEGEMDKPVEGASKLLYAQPYDEESAKVQNLDENQKSPRFGRPETYTVKFGAGGGNTGSQVVHHSRIIHVAQDRLQDNNYGTPQLESIYNRLQDIETISGASSEMFWQAAFQGLAFILREGATMTTTDVEDLEDEIERYVHRLQRILRLKNMDVESLGGTPTDPGPSLDKQIELISAAKQIPKRILLGSERGELASSQDEREYKGLIDERRRLFCEPQIVRPFIDRMIRFGILPKPEEKEDGSAPYIVDWPDLFVLTELQKAEVAASMAKALKDYMDGNVGSIIPPDMFLRIIAGLTENDIDKINAALEEMTALDRQEVNEE